LPFSRHNYHCSRTERGFATTLETHREKLVHIEIATLDKNIFDQIAALVFPGQNAEDLLPIAEEYGIALVVDQDEQAWIVVREPTRLWRWNPFHASQLRLAIDKYPWMDKLPQVFLVKRGRGQK